MRMMVVKPNGKLSLTATALALLSAGSQSDRSPMPQSAPQRSATTNA